MAQSPRRDLQDVLVGILGSPNVYFQPPENLVMNYPCIVYNRDNTKVKFAGNKPYNVRKRYQVTVIAADPDSDIVDKIAQLPMCTFNRHFTADKLNHDVYNIFF